MKIQEFVQELTHEERHEIVRTYKQFEKDGFIGDEAIRIQTEKLMEILQIPSAHVTRYMEVLVSACYRYYYDQLFSE